MIYNVYLTIFAVYRIITALWNERLGTEKIKNHEAMAVPQHS
jgi:hypothetical protein